MAASFTKLAKSAPLKPTVCLAMPSNFTPLESGLPLECIFRMAIRPLISGLSSIILRSNLPGRSNAWSSISGRLVAASIITLVEVSKPSISTSIWFRVCSRSSWLPPSPAPRDLPTASISSIKIIQGALRLACSKRSLTREAPTPTNISTNSLPLIEKKGTPASPAMARASNVLPVPGGPTSNIPLGIRAPRAWNFSRCFKNSTTSTTSCLASSTPATSLKVTEGLSAENILALERPKLICLLLAPRAWLKKKKSNAPIRIIGKKLINTAPQSQPLSGKTSRAIPSRLSPSIS